MSNYQSGVQFWLGGDQDSDTLVGGRVLDSESGIIQQTRALNGLDGNDLLVIAPNATRWADLDGGQGDDTMIGGLSANNNFRVDSQGDVVVGGSGAFDSVMTTENRTNLADKVASGQWTGVEQVIFNGLGNAVITGDAGNNLITGGTGADLLDGGAGNDTLVGGQYVNFGSGITSDGSSDTLIGGTGIDTVMLHGSRDDYAIARNVLTGDLTVTDKDTGGVDVLRGVEIVQFDNGSWSDQGQFDVKQDDDEQIWFSTTANQTITSGATTVAGALQNTDAQIKVAVAINPTTDAVITASQNAAPNDIYVVSHAGVKITDTVGIDTVELGGTLNSFNLATNGVGVENLYVTQNGAINTTLTGNDLDNQIVGGAGQDNISAGNGNDDLAGADPWGADSANDTLNGGAGIDTAWYNGTPDDYTVVEDGVTRGNWTVTRISTGAVDTLVGIERIKFLTVSGGQETVNAVLQSAAFTSSVTVSGDSDAWNPAQAAKLTGSAGNDNLLIGAEKYSWSDGEGSHTSGVFTVDSGAGNDTITFFTDDTVGAGPVRALGGEGNDRIVALGDGYAELNGGAGADTLIGNKGNNLFTVDSLADSVIGGGGNSDAIFIDSSFDTNGTVAGAGSFTVSATQHNGIQVFAYQGSQDITLNGAAIATGLLLAGSTGRDSITGGAGNDILTGQNFAGFGGGLDGKGGYFGQGANPSLTTVYDGNTKGDTLDGGAGTDTVYYSGNWQDYSFSRDTVTGSWNVTSDVTGRVDVLKNIEVIQFDGGSWRDQNWNDRETADDAQVRFSTVAGQAMNGGDTPLPYHVGGGSIDAANDVYVINHTGVVITEQSGSVYGNDTVIIAKQSGIVDYTLGANLENLRFGQGITAGVKGTGNQLDNFIAGASGNDTLNGGAGNDTLKGNGGSDTIYGGSGDNTAVFDGVPGDYEVSRFGAVTVVKHLGTGAIDTLVNVQHLKFAPEVGEPQFVHLNWVGDGAKNADGVTLQSGTTIDATLLANDGAGYQYVAGTRGADTINVTKNGYVEVYDGDLGAQGSGDTINLKGTGYKLAVLHGTDDKVNFDSVAGSSTTGGLAVHDNTDLNDSRFNFGNVKSVDLIYVGEIFRDGEGNPIGADDSFGSYNNTAPMAAWTAIGKNGISNLILGGTGSDSLTGGDKDDALSGFHYSGYDRGLVREQWGNDTLDGGAGTDTAIFHGDMSGPGGYNMQAYEDGLKLNLFNSFDVYLERNGETGAYRFAQVDYHWLGNTGSFDGSHQPIVGENTASTTLQNIEVLSWDNWSWADKDDDLEMRVSTAGNTTLTGGDASFVRDDGTTGIRAGNDAYVILHDGVAVNDTAGDDTIFAAGAVVDYDLTKAAGVENLVFLDAGLAVSHIGTGNALDNYISGGVAADTLRGGDGQDVLVGNAGNDSLDGGNGNDVLLGGDGNDILNGGTGVDTLDGGNGNDTYIVDNALDVIKSTGSGAVATIKTGVDFDVDARNQAGLLDLNVDTVRIELTGGVATKLSAAGVDADVHLRGNSLANTITGGLGNDVLVGGAGADTLDGGAGWNKLFGDNDQSLTNLAADVFRFSSTNGGSEIFGFTSGADKLQFVQGSNAVPGLGKIASGDGVFGTELVTGGFGFKESSEVVIFKQSVGDAGNANQVASLLNNKCSGLMTEGEQRLFVMNNGSDSFVYQFTNHVQGNGADKWIDLNGGDQLRLIGVVHDNAALTAADILLA